MKTKRVHLHWALTAIITLLAGCREKAEKPAPAALPSQPMETVSRDEAAGAPSAHAPTATLIDFSELDRFLSKHSGLFRHAEVLIRKDGKVIYTYGDVNTPVNAASCSKWLGAAAIMKLVEEGRLDLDASAADYLIHCPHRLQSLTLRKLLSHTSGLKPPKLDEGAVFSDLPFRRSVYSRLHFRKEKEPAFCYNNLGFNFAGEIASTAVHKAWSTLFQDGIAIPLGMGHTWFPNHKPTPAGGAHVSAADYSRFLEMFRMGGISMEGRRVLKPETIAEMLKNQTPGLPLECVPRPSKRKESYGLGVWREGGGEIPRLASHFGSEGYKVFLDFCRDLSAVFAMEYRGGRKRQGRDMTRSIYDIVERAIPVNASCAAPPDAKDNQWTPPMRPPESPPLDPAGSPPTKPPSD